MNIRYSFPTCSVLMLSAALVMVGGQGARAEGLQDAVSAAVQNHPSAEAALSALAAKKEERKAEKSAYFPELSLSASAGRIYGDNSTSRGLSVTRGAAYSGMGEGAVMLRQPISGVLETTERVDAAQARMLSAESSLDDIREELAFRTVQAYLNVARAQESLKMMEEYKANAAGYAGKIGSMVEQGAADAAEKKQADEILLVLETLVTDAQGQVTSANAAYAALTGHAPESELQRPQPPFDLIATDVSQEVEAALQAHPALTAAENQALAAGYDTQAEKHALYPDLDTELSYLKSDKRDVIGGEVVDARALLRLNWTLDTGGEQFARIRQRRYQEGEAKARSAEVRRQIEQGVRQAYAEYETARAQVVLLEKRVALGKELFQTYKTQFGGGKITQLQLMQAENQVFNAGLEKMNGDYRLMAAAYGVLAASRRLDDAFALPVSDVAAKPATSVPNGKK